MVEVCDAVLRGRRVWRLWRWEQLPRLGSVLRGPVLELHYQPSGRTWRELEALVDAEQAESPWCTPHPTAPTTCARSRCSSKPSTERLRPTAGRDRGERPGPSQRMCRTHSGSIIRPGVPAAGPARWGARVE